MGQTVLHANLTSRVFPFNSRELSSTVVVNRGFEQNRNMLRGFDGEEPEQSFGICQAFFMRNVLPLARGYSSVHFTRRVAAQAVSSNALESVHLIRSATGELALLSAANGDMAVYIPATGVWSSNPLNGIVHPTITTAYLKGVTYICVSGLGVYTYNFATSTLELQTLEAIDATRIKGVCSAGSYLLLWNDDTIYWSSPINPLDFTPAEDRGGSTQVLAVKGQITCLLQISGGFIAYTDKNASSGVFSGNGILPFIFDEVAGSAGVARPDHVSFDSNYDRHVAWTASGFQFVTLKKADNIWPDLSDSLGRNLAVVANPAQADFPDLLDITTLQVRINVVGARYITISIAESANIPDNFEFAYIYDSGLDRWGRLDIPHVDIFEFSAPEFAQLLSWDDLKSLTSTWDQLNNTSWSDLLGGVRNRTAQFGKTFGVINRNGEVFTAALAKDAASASADTQSVTGAAVPQLLLGRYKIVRENGVTLEWLLPDELISGSTVRAYAHDYNGNYNTHKDITVQSARTDNKWYGRQSGDAISLGLFGRFNLTNLSICLSDAGKRNILHNPPRYIPPALVNSVVVGADSVVVGADSVVVPI